MEKTCDNVYSEENDILQNCVACIVAFILSFLICRFLL